MDSSRQSSGPCRLGTESRAPLVDTVLLPPQHPIHHAANSSGGDAKYWTYGPAAPIAVPFTHQYPSFCNRRIRCHIWGLVRLCLTPSHQHPIRVACLDSLRRFLFVCEANTEHTGKRGNRRLGQKAALTMTDLFPFQGLVGFSRFRVYCECVRKSSGTLSERTVRPP